MRLIPCLPRIPRTIALIAEFPFKGNYNSFKMLAQTCRTECCVLLTSPQPRLDPQKNQNGTMAKDALFLEKFISAECVR